MKSVQNMLEELGLSPNEVKVYLAGLELGAATAQQLAAKAAVVRPTAYVAIGGLVKHGLMSSFTKGKKQFYASEKPNRLTHLLNEEKKKLAERESKLKSVMPILDSLIALSGEKPEVKLYEGLEGLEAMRQTLFDSKSTRLDVVGAGEAIQKQLPEEARVLYGLRLKKAGVAVRHIVIGDPKRIKMPEIVPKHLAYKYISKPDFQFSGEIAIFGEYIALTTYSGQIFGVLIRSKDVAGLLSHWFSAYWEGIDLKRLQK